MKKTEIQWRQSDFPKVTQEMRAFPEWSSFLILQRWKPSFQDHLLWVLKSFIFCQSHSIPIFILCPSLIPRRGLHRFLLSTISSSLNFASDPHHRHSGFLCWTVQQTSNPGASGARTYHFLASVLNPSFLHIISARLCTKTQTHLCPNMKFLFSLFLISVIPVLQQVT